MSLDSQNSDSLILWDVVEEHLDEAEFLYEQWEACSTSAMFTREELTSGPEARLEAHLDGLRVAGPPVLSRLISPIVDDESAEYARLVVSLLTLLSVGDWPANFQTVVSLLHNGESLQRRAAFQALLLSERTEVPRALAQGLDTSHLDVLRLLGYRGHDPGFERLRALANSDDVQQVATALEVFALFGYPEARPIVDSLLKERPAVGLELQVARAATVLGLPAWRYCYDALGKRPDLSAQLMQLLSCDEKLRFHHDVIRLLDTSPREALWTLGFIGTVESAEAVLPFIGSDDDKIARLAGEAFRAITGLDSEDDSLHRDPTEPTAEQTLPDFEGDDLDADLGDDPIDDLPLPQASKYEEYWSHNQANFETSVRYIGGVRQELNVLTDHLERVSTRRRHHLAFQIRVLSYGKTVVPTWLWGRQQLRAKK